jgi:hypothetical protein
VSRSLQNGVICVEVDQRITSSKSDIVDVYREELARGLNPVVPLGTDRGPDNRPSDLTH